MLQKAPSALLMAHPGHELFLHHWLETERPLVFVLSDGSGGRGEDRRAASARIIQAAGASIGPVFGLAPDQRWYAAILAGEGDLFDQARRLILTACRAAGVRRIVTDPVELYNPLHDLCNALATGIARSLAREEESEIELLDYAIEHPDLKNGRAQLELPVSGEAYARKRAAVASYLQLAAEVERRDWTAAIHGSEKLYAPNGAAAWPPEPPEEPFYEEFGRRRIAEGLYRDLITYRAHVRPLALVLSGG